MNVTYRWRIVRQQVAWAVATVALCCIGILVGGPFLLASAAALCNVLQVFFFAKRVRDRFEVDATVLALLRAKSATPSTSP